MTLGCPVMARRKGKPVVLSDLVGTSPTKSKDSDDSLSATAQRVTGTIKPFFELFGFIAALSIPFVAVRVLAAAGFNLTVALAILANSNASDLIVAFLVLSIPAWLYLLAVALAVDAGGAEAKHRGSSLLWLLSLSGYIALSETYWFEVAIYAGAPLATFVFIYYIDKGKSRDESRRENLKFITVITLPILVGIVTSSTIWLPPERLVIKGRAEKAFVLREVDQDLVVLMAKENVVLRIKKAEISERQYCVPKGSNPLRRRGADARPVCPPD
jgi:hypothetical protein